MHYTPDFRTRSVQTGRLACDARRNMGEGDLPGSAAARCGRVFLERCSGWTACQIRRVAAGYYGSLDGDGAGNMEGGLPSRVVGCAGSWRNIWREVLITGCLAARDQDR